MSVSENSDFLGEVVGYLESGGYDVDRATLRETGLSIKVDIPDKELVNDE